jgi:hypothetical protein
LTDAISEEDHEEDACSRCIEACTATRASQEASIANEEAEDTGARQGRGQ